MKIQLCSCHYEPEPMGIAPVSATLARGLHSLGHDVRVVAAHPHYPDPSWGTRIRPYREIRDGLPVMRLPVWVGRASAAQRIRQELSFTAAMFAALPFLGRPDVILAASPSFPALLPAVIDSRLRRVPLVAWLHDVLPEGAMATGLVEGGPVLRASRWLERTAYRRAVKVVVLSLPFLSNLRSKGVPEEKLELIYDPATRPPQDEPRPRGGPEDEPARVICIGNTGLSQGLPPLVRAFDRSELTRRAAARLVITGSGVAEGDVRGEIRSDLVEMLGVVSEDRLREELRAASLALVSQRYEGTEFNLPSKVMNYMAWGLPIIAAVDPGSEVARLVQESGAGWVVDSSKPVLFPRAVTSALADPEEMRRRSRAGLDFAREHFTPEGFAARFESLLLDACGDQASARAASVS